MYRSVFLKKKDVWKYPPSSSVQKESRSNPLTEWKFIMNKNWILNPLPAQQIPVTVQWTSQNPSFLISALKKLFVSIVAVTHVPLKPNLQQ